MISPKGSILLFFSNVIYLILFIECTSDKVFDEYKYREPVDNRIKRSLTTICVEIKPSRPQEEPYLMCKAEKHPGFVQQVPYTKNNIFLSNDHNIISTHEYGQDKSDYSARQRFPYFKNLHNNVNENSWLGERGNYQIKYLSTRNPYQQPTYDAFQFVNRYAQPIHFSSETTTSSLNSDRFDQRFSTPMPSILSKFEYRGDNEVPSIYHNTNNEYLETKKINADDIAQPYGHAQKKYDYFNNFHTQTSPLKQSLQLERWNFNPTTDSLQLSLNVPFLALEDTSPVPSATKELPLVNDTLPYTVRPGDIPHEWSSKNKGANEDQVDWTGIPLTSKVDNFPQSLSNSYIEKNIFNNFNTLPFADDPVMQQFYNSLYDTPVLTVPQKDAAGGINNLNKQYSADNLHDTLQHTTIRSQRMQEGQCDDFRKESITVSEAPSNQYCTACPPEMGYTLPPVIITLPCYNPSPVSTCSNSLPCYRFPPPTYNNLHYENFVRENKYLQRPEATGLGGTSYNPLVNIFQPKLYPHFSMIPRLGNLLSSARTILPTLHAAHGIFRGATPIPGISQSNILTYTSQPITMSPPKMFSNDFHSQIGDVTVATQLGNIQTTTLPTHTALVGSSGFIPSTSIKSIEDSQNSTLDSFFLQSRSQIRNFTTIKPIARTHASTTEDVNQTGEESTKKILTIIEKARRLQMRHRINSN